MTGGRVGGIIAWLLQTSNIFEAYQHFLSDQKLLGVVSSGFNMFQHVSTCNIVETVEIVGLWIPGSSRVQAKMGTPTSFRKASLALALQGGAP